MLNNWAEIPVLYCPQIIDNCAKKRGENAPFLHQCLALKLLFLQRKMALKIMGLSMFIVQSCFLDARISQEASISHQKLSRQL